MKKITVFYGSTTGNTGSAAKAIAAALGDGAEARDVSGADANAFSEPDVLVLGTSTWGVGDLQDDWVGALDALKGARLAGKKVAVFGLGDQNGFGDSFVDGMRDLYDAAIAAGGTVVGACATDGYEFSESRAVVDGQFVGLVLDDDNQAGQTDARIAAWVTQLKQELGMS
ncbi:flavodoxin [Kiritimatiella glycovorans]|uniref:Flavodoxin n=1 Tax=Kiritimatiella glycovorans TaxID=1307763 RepID=A0A0G3EL43_9BACT|nr:flavodoxin [Kiritimatiella glycovorans]AKJ64849.1 Flavodoxin [Kiritimatiella glycovorans]